MKKKTKCYIYTRVSTAIQVDGYSLDAQKDKLKKYAEFQDMEIVGEYSDEGHSGKNIKGRQEFMRMLNDIEDGIDSSKEAGKLLISIIAAVAEMERENIRAQTMAGREQKAREDKWNGGFAPYGYRLENGELAQEKRLKNNYRREKIHDPEHAHILSGIPDITIIARIP